MIISFCFEGCSLHDNNSDTVVIQMTYPTSANAPHDLEMQWVSKKVYEETNGAVEIQLFPNSGLASDKNAFDEVATGNLDSAGITLNAIAQTIPELNTRCLPFAFDDIDHYWRVVSSTEYHDNMTQLLDDYDVVYLGNSGNALRGIASKKPIHTPKDSNNMTIRIMDGTIYEDYYDSLGFNTSTISFGETYLAIQQGIVDGCDCDLNSMEFMGFEEVCPYYIETNQVVHGLCHVVKKELWEKISAENQQKIITIFSEMENGISYNIWEEYYSKTKENLLKNGIEIYELSSDEQKQWKESALPIYSKYEKIIGEEYYNWYMDLLDKYKNSAS